MYRERRTPHDWVYRTGRWRKLRLVILRRDGWRCQVAERGKQCASRAQTVDHIRPVSLGGAIWDPGNLRACCRPHNASGGGALRAWRGEVSAARERARSGTRMVRAGAFHPE